MLTKKDKQCKMHTMEKKLYFSFLLVLLLFSSCGTILKERASWDFIQKANFIIGSSYTKNGVYYLPFTCDLKISNSAPLAIIKSNVKVIHDEIDFYLIYTLSRKDNISEIKIGKINPGNYKIYYIDNEKEKYFIKNITVE
jgi:hypothetical protein